MEDSKVNNICHKVKKYRIAKKIVSSGPVMVLVCLLVIGLTIASIPLPSILCNAGIISQNLGAIALFGLPVIVFLSSAALAGLSISVLSVYFEIKKEESIKELMELSNQIENSLDSTIIKSEIKREEENSKYTSITNDYVMAKVNLFTSVTNKNMIRQELEEEWKIYLFDKISEGASDEFIKEIIYGLILLNSDNAIENIYEKLSKNTEVLEALIYFSPRGKELEKIVSKYDNSINEQRNIQTAVNTTLYLTLHK